MKLRRPLPGEHYLRRPRLMALVDDIVRAPVALVVAPAGSGKTSLLAGWTVETPMTTAWLSLDESDRDWSQLWAGLIAALETVAPGCGQQARAMLRRSGQSDGALDQLLADLEIEDQAPALLVIDDFHVVDQDPATVASVSHFLAHLPNWLHVALLSRRDPDLPLGRMRSHGRLGELRFAELRFSPDEAADLLVRLAPSLSATQVEAAVERADGWAASLQLVALAARASRAWPGTDDSEPDDAVLLADYVLNEVLASESPDVVEVLSAAALVPRVNADLARALTDRADAGELLAQAERRGLLVTRRSAGTWFDLHALVRGVLTADFQRRSPTRLAELRVRAARWYEDAGEIVAALEQWIQAGEPREALRLLATNEAQLYDSGREATIVRVIGAIPVGVAVSDIETMVEYAWCHLLVDRRRFVELVDHLTWWVDRAPPSEVMRARVTMLRACSAVVSGHWVESGELARQSLGELGETWWQDPLGRFGWNLIIREIALSERWDDLGDDVRGAIGQLSRDPERRLSFEGTRAVGLALSGRPVDALRVAAGVRHAAAISAMTILRTELELAEALAHRELGDRSRADADLAVLAALPAQTMLYCRVLGSLELVEARLDANALDAAADLFGRIEALIDAESFGPGGRLWLVRTGTRLALATGRVEDARRWASGLDDPFWGPVCTARVHLAAGDRHEAVVALDSAVARCVRHDVVLGLVRAHSLADRHAALKHVTAAVELASEHGMLQTVASEGAGTMELVEEAAWRAPPDWLDRLRRTAAEARCLHGSPRRDLIEPLTERERDVLRFLPSRLTIREIADELYVSVNTLKFHLKVIYRKLGVSSRAEAADIAREMMRVRSP